ncbi:MULTISPECIES: P-loop NTPase fold protein [unclassified Pseudomonas]|uniref:P-loop NTPase fold protein n=1 Tax=unclassified Pseudomonas TaxID=196821 RepID=UPI0011A0BC4C|nr:MULTISPECIES: P-loop NTPase fold protein [unclassified Pseudomonas]TWC17782.1 KAP-like P-loop domain-containing protein [Pseudomonas sp. SJZ083]TWC45341.1 KAP-like P-loop domain-containing protein [Pseudomonas sp. SJZ077]
MMRIEEANTATFVSGVTEDSVQERCAWIFQYAVGNHVERKWLSSRERGQTAPWKVSRFRNLIRAGDLVFYWQTTAKGGLRGWGEIETGELFEVRNGEGEQDLRIGVREQCWLEPPIPRERVLAAGALDQKNDLLTIRQGTNFRLTPDEAARLAALLPEDQRPELGGLITQEQRKQQLHGKTSETNEADNLVQPVKQVQKEEDLDALFNSDDPWSASLEDKIGVMDEAAAMAALAMRTAEPPLAVGIFGNWGTGKSFFMRMIHRQIQEQDHLKETVLIRFNAWHFVDSNLWASLVDHIFTELDQWVRKIPIAEARRRTSEQLFDNLATAQELALEAVERLVRRRKVQKVATQRLADAERNASLFWVSVIGTLKGQGQWQKVESAAQSLGLGPIVDDARRLKETIDGLSQEHTRSRIIMGGLLQRLGSWPTLLAGVAIILLLPPAFAKGYDYLSGGFGVQITTLTQDLLTLSAPLLGLAGGMALILKRVRTAVDQLAGFRSTLEQVVAQHADEKDRTLSKLEADVEEARSLLVTTTERVAEATRDFDSGTGRGRMLRFIRDRANDGHYASHLGLVAAIRKDFEELSRGLKDEPDATSRPINTQLQQRIKTLMDDSDLDLLPADRLKLESMLEAVTAPPFQGFKRIVLFIDDLDRCPPAKVVEVLQAVHLLLGFPLFIVFVAADVRWVNRALNTHYPDLLDNPQAGQASTGQGATAHDYLEKIFQIPYWVRSLNADASKALLESRIRAGRPLIQRPAQAPSQTEVPNQTFVEVEGVQMEQAQDSESGEAIADKIVRELSAMSSEDFNDRADRFRLSQDERDFLSLMAPFAGSSPRRILRFINTYRIIKISLPFKESQLLETRHFPELLLQLTINTGAPEVFGQWVDFLHKNATALDFRQLLGRLVKATSYKELQESVALQGALQAYIGTKNAGSVQDAIESSKLVKRYSFVG